MNAPNLPVAKSAPQNHALALLMDEGKFAHMQRVGAMLAVSPLFPEHLRKGSQQIAVANAVLVLNMASRLNEDPLTVGQNIYFVGGKPGWSSSYMIAKANQHGVFRDPIDWNVKGSGDTLAVEAFGVLTATGKRVAVTCDMKMAKAEGWTNNKKYTSMPEQMLRYRSATFLIRLYCPEVMVGVPTTVELELGMRDVTPDYGPSENLTGAEQAVESTAQDAETIDAETGEVVDTAATAEQAAPQETKPAADPSPKPAQQQAQTQVQEQAQQATAKPAQEQRPAAAQAHAPDPEQFVALFTLIEGELATASPQEVEEMYGPQMEQMAAFAPDLHAKLRALFNAKTA